jgi:hypothetical protein
MAAQFLVRREIKEEFLKANEGGKLYESYKKYCEEVLNILEKDSSEA